MFCSIVNIYNNKCSDFEISAVCLYDLISFNCCHLRDWSAILLFLFSCLFDKLAISTSKRTLVSSTTNMTTCSKKKDPVDLGPLLKHCANTTNAGYYYYYYYEHQWGCFLQQPLVGTPLATMHQIRVQRWKYVRLLIPAGTNPY